MKHLYEISNEYQKIIDLIEECDEISPEHLTMLGEVSDDANQKVINVAAYIKNLEDKSLSMDAYIKNMQDRQRKVDTKIESLKEYLKYNMDILKLEKVESKEFDVQIRSNKYALELFDQSVIPQEYIRVKESITISRQDIIKDLKVGCEIPGARFTTTKSVLIK